jgi:ankyrin repeat protein
VVRALIEADADVSKADDNGLTPLFMAAQNGHAAIVQILGDAGAA